MTHLSSAVAAADLGDGTGPKMLSKSLMDGSLSRLGSAAAWSPPAVRGGLILHRALREGCATLYGLYFYGRGSTIAFSYFYLYNSWARTFPARPGATWNESHGMNPAGSRGSMHHEPALTASNPEFTASFHPLNHTTSSAAALNYQIIISRCQRCALSTLARPTLTLYIYL